MLPGDPFQRLENELSEETHVLTKQKTLLGRGAGVESRRVELLYHMAHCLRFYAKRVISLGVVAGQSCLAHIWSDLSFYLVVKQEGRGQGTTFKRMT